MNREDLAASALLALPVAIREARGEEILGTLLDCGRPPGHMPRTRDDPGSLAVGRAAVAVHDAV
jgi:hypothetical protein